MQHIIKKDYSTKQRNIILEILKKNIDKKVTADEIIHAINKDENIISKATVYRNLDYLASKGVIKKINADNISSCYIYNSDENDDSINFYCDTCGEIVQLKCTYIERFNNKLQKDFDCTIDKSKTVLHGTCNKCKELSND